LPADIRCRIDESSRNTVAAVRAAHNEAGHRPDRQVIDESDQCEGTIVSSCFLRPLIRMQDLLWGLPDGMNDASLAVSLTWGGRSAYGRGFAILIVVR
jgi:hypothetical protein